MPTAVRDALTEVLRDGRARCWLRQSKRRCPNFYCGIGCADEEGGSGSCATATCPSARYRPASAHGVRAPRVRDRRRDQIHLGDPAALPAADQEPGGVDPLALPKGVSTGDFSEALQAILGPDARDLSATTITRLKAVWEEEHEAWSKRSLAGKHYVYVWADGVHFNIRLEEGRQCILVLMGATAEGKKELIAIADGYRESEQSWKELLLE